MTPVVKLPEPHTQQPEEAAPELVLEKALTGGIAEPWLKTFVRNIKEMMNPVELPPLEVTSKPVAVKDIWGAYGGNESRSGVVSVLIHVGIVSLLLILGTNPTIQKKMKETADSWNFLNNRNGRTARVRSSFSGQGSPRTALGTV